MKRILMSAFVACLACSALGLGVWAAFALTIALVAASAVAQHRRDI